MFVADDVAEHADFCVSFMHARAFDVKKNEFHFKDILTQGVENINRYAVYLLTFETVYTIIFVLMKKLLTILACEKVNNDTDPQVEEIEFIEADEKNGIKQAKGKYTLLLDGDVAFFDIEPFFGELEKATADIVAFEGGHCFKSSVLKGLSLKDDNDRYSVEILAANASKSIYRSEIRPFSFNGVRTGYSDGVAERLEEALAEFKKSKAKLPKDVYSFVFDMICQRLVSFYMSAMLAVRKKQIEAETLLNFDAQLKEDIVLYLALEKRFTAADLKRLRDKKFKLDIFTALKFEKILKGR